MSRPPRDPALGPYLPGKAVRISPMYHAELARIANKYRRKLGAQCEMFLLPAFQAERAAEDAAAKAEAALKESP